MKTNKTNKNNKIAILALHYEDLYNYFYGKYNDDRQLFCSIYEQILTSCIIWSEKKINDAWLSVAVNKHFNESLEELKQLRESLHERNMINK